MRSKSIRRAGMGTFLALYQQDTPFFKPSVAPTVPVFCMLVVTVRNYREMDEFMQRVQGESLLWIIGVICFLSFGYGMLEMVLGVVPPIGVIWILPTVCLGSGLMNFILMRRYHAE
ncbi:MAG: hypothetical protein OSB05_07380 [Akkermansiaceae bacterium]|nr:hypothetical protein [Akkermansiaceae bacterium]